METKLTAEQRKQLNRLELKFLFKAVYIAIYYAALLVLINFVTTLAILLMEGPEWFMFVCCAVAGFFIFKKVLSISKEFHDRLIQETKKITESK